MKTLRARGFTLIEVLVALALFAVLSAVAYRGLATVLGARERLAAETLKWRDVSAAFSLIGQALANAVDRPVRDRDDRIAVAFAGIDAARRPDEALLEFTRTGFAGRAGALADLQRVGFVLNGERLEQYVWPALDRAPGSRPQALTLLEGVSEVGLRFLDRSGAWHAFWPRPDQDEALPAAVGLSIRLANGKQLTRVFALP